MHGDARRILADVTRQIWSSDHMIDTLSNVCGFGSRFAGDTGERLTRELIVARLQESGVARLERWAFDYLAWHRGACHLTVLSPATIEVPAISLVGSPPTAERGVTADVISLGNGTREAFERAGAAIMGKIVVVTSDSPRDERPIHRRDKYGWAVEHGAAGFLFVNHLPGFPALTGSLRPGRIGEIPGASLAYEDGMALLRQVECGPVSVRLSTKCTAAPASSQHIFAEIPGQTDDAVVLSAHYDGHDISPSALDNGSGLVTALELARVLAPYAGQFRRTIRIALWTVEEWGVYGSDRYLLTLSDDDLARINLVINLDVTAGLGAPSWSLNGFSELAPRLQQYTADGGYACTTDNAITAGSDHFPFILRGIPAIWLRSTLPADHSSRRFILTELDTLDKVSADDLKAAAALAATVLVRAATDPAPLAARRSRAEVQAMLREQGWEDALRAQGKWPGDPR